MPNFLEFSEKNFCLEDVAQPVANGRKFGPLGWPRAPAGQHQVVAASTKNIRKIPKNSYSMSGQCRGWARRLPASRKCLMKRKNWQFSTNPNLRNPLPYPQPFITVLSTYTIPIPTIPLIVTMLPDLDCFPRFLAFPYISDPTVSISNVSSSTTFHLDLTKIHYSIRGYTITVTITIPSLNVFGYTVVLCWASTTVHRLSSYYCTYSMLNTSIQ